MAASLYAQENLPVREFKGKIKEKQKGIELFI